MSLRQIHVKVSGTKWLVNLHLFTFRLCIRPSTFFRVSSVVFVSLSQIFVLYTPHRGMYSGIRILIIHIFRDNRTDGIFCHFYGDFMRNSECAFNVHLCHIAWNRNFICFDDLISHTFNRNEASKK